jgi:cyclopropane fatty-acyl-phospholipid synthase-like methyltransferase
VPRPLLLAARLGIGPGARTLEVGCGNGSMSAWLAGQVAPGGGAGDGQDQHERAGRRRGSSPRHIAFKRVAVQAQSADRVAGYPRL